MAQKRIAHSGEDVILEAHPVVDLDRGVRSDLFLGRASSLVAAYTRAEDVGHPFLIEATSEADAIAQIERALATGLLVRRDVSRR